MNALDGNRYRLETISRLEQDSYCLRKEIYCVGRFRKICQSPVATDGHLWILLEHKDTRTHIFSEFCIDDSTFDIHTV